MSARLTYPRTVASSKTSKPLRLGRRAAEVYRLCESVLRVRRWLDSEERSRKGAIEISDERTALVLKRELAGIVDLRFAFESKLVTNPSEAVAEFERWNKRSFTLPMTRKDRLRQAVVGVERWLSDGEEWRFLALHGLESVIPPPGSASPGRLSAYLDRLLARQDIRKALHGEAEYVVGARRRPRKAPRTAAILIVARASGIGEQTVRRALR